MNKLIMKRILIGLSVFISVNLSAQWAFRLPAIISDHAVFQQSSDVKLWGWGQSGSTVKIICSWNPADTIRAEPRKDWTWDARMKTPGAGGPYDITFISSTQKVVVRDILIGEVWLCSGQSNMEMNFANPEILDAGDAVEKANNKEMRFFRLTHQYENTPREHSDGIWEVCSPETVKYMSAAGYFFGKKILDSIHVPVGLIASYWGGTSVQAWTPAETYQKDPELKKLAEKLSPVNWSPTEPSVIYNAMIHPLINYNIAGAIWYQGEANTEYPEDYGKLFAALINSWRNVFQKEFPFYFVQIAPWNGYWGISAALLREQQESALTLPKTGMITVGDLVDDITDIHPRLKRQVGERLGNLVLKEQYGMHDLQPYSPRFKSLTIQKDKAIINLSSAGKLTCRDKEILGFRIAGNDKVFHPAKARLQKDGSVTLTSKAVKSPVAVRYCFTNDGMPNLFDSNGLPPVPFRTDSW